MFKWATKIFSKETRVDNFYRVPYVSMKKLQKVKCTLIL